ncbi:MAG: histidine kinase [Desulfobacterales bacterium]
MSHFRKFLPLVAFLLFGSIAVILWQNQNKHEREFVFQYTETSSEQIRIRIQGLMNARMASLEVLADRWVQRIPPDFSRKRFLEFAENLYTHYPGFMGINWIDPEGVIRWVFPMKSNENVIGKSVYELRDSKVRDTFQEAGKNLQYIATPCVEIIQGEPGFHTFWPLIYTGKVQGFLNGVFQVKLIVDTCLPRNIFKEFWVRLYEAGRVIYTNEKQSDSNLKKDKLHVVREIHFPGKIWQLELIPKAAIYPPRMVWKLFLLTFGLAVSAILSILLHLLLQRMQMYRLARDHALQEVSERKKAEDLVRKLSQTLMQAQERERQMISYELHDSIGQNLSTLKIGCDMLLENQPAISPESRGKMAELSKLLEQTITAVRNLAYGLQPPGLDEMGLVQALEMYCEEFYEKNGVKVDFQSAGLHSFDLDSNSEIHIYRLVQEGLNNIRKHADAAQVNMMLMGASPNIILRIEDNGKGFDVKARELALSNEKRMGLRSMKERVNLLGGQMTIQSRPMQGTKILIKIPFKKKKNESEKAHINH